MSKVYVSQYDKVFTEAFGGAIEQMPASYTESVKSIFDKIMDDVVLKLEHYMNEEMKSNLDGAIRWEASQVAESMLADALAGDDKQIRNLFGFNEWYMKHLYRGNKPTQWVLIEALMERRPDIFENEKIAQQKRQIESLEAEVKRLGERIRELAMVE